MRLACCIGCLAAVSAPALADGAFLAPNPERTDIREPEQKAVIYWHDGTEDLILNASYEGAPADFAWVVPVPAKPQVEEFDGAIFHELARLTAPPPMLEGRQDKAKSMAAAPTAPAVEVVERKEVGPYDVAVLTATGAGALSQWLERNGYRFPAEHAAVLEHYTRGTWHFVAMRVAPGKAGRVAGLASGAVASIRLTFACPDAPLYPLRISAINEGATEVLLYLLGERCYGPANPDGLPGSQFREECRGHFRCGRRELALAKLLGARADCVVTKLRAHVGSREMIADLSLRPVADAPKLHQFRYTDHRGRTRTNGERSGRAVIATLGGIVILLLWALGRRRRVQG